MRQTDRSFESECAKGRVDRNSDMCNITDSKKSQTANYLFLKYIKIETNKKLFVILTSDIK